MRRFVVRRPLPFAATTVVVLASAILLPLAAAAQAEKPAAPSGQPDMAQMMEMMQPGPEHKLLTRLVGKWIAVNKLWMDPAGPPMEFKGDAEWRPVLGGRYVEGHYTSAVMGQPFEGLSIEGYDRYKKEYFSIWFDTMGTGSLQTRGTASADGKVFNMKGVWFQPSANADVSGRTASTWVDNDTWRQEMFETRGGKELKVMEVVYTRAK